jgi:NAD(P)-dependent dehydrogenase (short-subunit alcohol dehydrogenase family)
MKKIFSEIEESENLKGKKIIFNYLKLDLSDLESVKKYCGEIIQKYKKIDFLYLNAGVMKRFHQVSKQNLEITFQVNYLSNYLILKLLKKIIVNTEGLFFFLKFFFLKFF